MVNCTPTVPGVLMVLLGVSATVKNTLLPMYGEVSITVYCWMGYVPFTMLSTAPGASPEAPVTTWKVSTVTGEQWVRGSP